MSQQVVAPLAPLARTAKAQGFLDMSVRYSPLDNLTLSLQAHQCARRAIFAMGRPSG